MNTKKIGIIVAALLIFTVNKGMAEGSTNPMSSTLPPQKHIMITPDNIVWGDCPPFLPAGAKCSIIEGDPKIPGALFTVRIKFSDSYKIPPHFHPEDEHITVISGTLKMGLGKTFEEQTMKPMPTGSFMVMPKTAPHFAQARGETIVQVHGLGPMSFTYINPKDDPRQQ